MNIRNVAIIAHVDHGKTTLVDALIRSSTGFSSKELATRDLIMDSNDLERERGITIFSKNAAIFWGDTKINVIDTPGHADFGGEVERVLSMADGCLLLVDAKEGPMPQTRFVLKQALKRKLKIIVVVNKIDKPDARPDYAINKVFDLFVELGADDASLDFPIVYASAKQAKAGLTDDLASMTNVEPIFEAIVKQVPAPGGDPAKPLQILITTISGDTFKGRIATGRVHNGTVNAGQDVMHINRVGGMKKYRLVSLMSFEGLNRIDATSASAGDIVALAGIPDITIGETIADVNSPVALPVLSIEEPTVKMTFSVNDSPFSGQEGVFSTSRQVRERLWKELETDMALRVDDVLAEEAAKGQAGPSRRAEAGPSRRAEAGWIVSGRGELHLAILIERMRREGYEFQVSRPQVIIKEVAGKKLAPFERVFIEVPEEHAGVILQKLGSRHGEVQDMKTENGLVYLEFIIPTRGLFGYRSEFLTDTRGLGIINTMFHGYAPDPTSWREREQGSLVAYETGTSNLYGLLAVQDRGVLFFGSGVPVYQGQVVGQHSRSSDLRINICKTKQLSNMRSKGDGSAEHFNAPRVMELEDALEYIGDDELVEVTPKNIRIRKVILDENEAKRVKAQSR